MGMGGGAFNTPRMQATQARPAMGGKGGGQQGVVRQIPNPMQNAYSQLLASSRPELAYSAFAGPSQSVQQPQQADPRMEYMKQLYAGQQQNPAFQIALGRGTAQPTQADLYAQQMMGISGGAGYNLQLTPQQIAEGLQQHTPQQQRFGTMGPGAGLASLAGFRGML